MITRIIAILTTALFATCAYTQVAFADENINVSLVNEYGITQKQEFAVMSEDRFSEVENPEGSDSVVVPVLPGENLKIRAYNYSDPDRDYYVQVSDPPTDIQITVPSFYRGNPTGMTKLERKFIGTLNDIRTEAGLPRIKYSVTLSRFLQTKVSSNYSGAVRDYMCWDIGETLGCDLNEPFFWWNLSNYSDDNDWFDAHLNKSLEYLGSGIVDPNINSFAIYARPGKNKFDFKMILSNCTTCSLLDETGDSSIDLSTAPNNPIVNTKKNPTLKVKSFIRKNKRIIRVSVNKAAKGKVKAFLRPTRTKRIFNGKAIFRKKLNRVPKRLKVCFYGNKAWKNSCRVLRFQ